MRTRPLSNFAAFCRVADRAARSQRRPPGLRTLWRDGPLAVVQTGTETRLERLGAVCLYGDREACVAAAIGSLKAA